METPINYKHGHRSRVKERYLREGIDTFADYEILELLLFFAIPRRDTKDMAHALLRTFSTLDAVLNASEEALCRVSGIGPHVAHFLSSLMPFAHYALKHEKRPPRYENNQDIGILFRKFFAEHPELPTAILLLDNSRQPLRVVRCPDVPNLASFSNRIPFLIEQAYSVNAPIMVLAERVPEGKSSTLFLASDVARDMESELITAGISLIELVSVSAYDQAVMLLRYMNGSLCHAYATDTAPLFDAGIDFDVSNTQTKEKLVTFFSTVMKKETAQAECENLLSVYPSLLSAATVPHDTLTKRDGVTATSAMLLKLAFGAYARAKVSKVLAENKVFKSAHELGAFFTDVIGSRPTETMALALFDERMKLISVKLLGSGTVNAAAFSYRMVLEETMKHKPRYAAISHNHPLGIALPSSQDISITRDAEKIFHGVNIGFLGHVIVTDREHFFVPRSAFCEDTDAPKSFFK